MTGCSNSSTTPRTRARTRAGAVAGAFLLSLVSAGAPGALAAEPTTLVAPPTAHTMGFRRVTSRQIALFLRGVSIVDPAGLAVVRLAATDDPETGSDDDEVTVVAVDAGTGTVFTNFGLLRGGTWDGEGSPVERLSNPTDVAVDRAGRVLIADTGNRRVVLMQHDGASLRPVRAYTGFLEPVGVAEDGRGGFYVCDRRFNAVFYLDTLTGRRGTFGLEVTFDRPVSVATVPDGDALAGGKRRAVVIVDLDGKRIRSFGPSGALRGSVQASDLSVKDARFGAVEIDYYGNVYAVDREAHRLHKFRDDLFPLASFGSEGTKPGQFLSPRGIAIHRRLGQVFLTERDGGQYLWIGTDITGFEAADLGRSVEFSFLLTEDSRLKLRVLDSQGKAVATVVPEQRVACGPQRATWDGTTSDGGRAPDGDYLAEIRARATYSSGSQFEKKALKAFTLGIAKDSP